MRIIHGRAFYLAPMFSYRHAYHAGNHADVLKHLVLMLCLDHMNSKDKPYTVVDTHAGAGLYALDSEPAQRTGECIDGIGRLWERKNLPAPLSDYMQLIRDLNSGSGKLRRYPGSPWIAERMAREIDRLRFYEMHSTDFALLRRQYTKAGRRVSVEQIDGFDGLKASLPPASRRGLVLIDPSYEIKSDYMKVATAVKDALKRFATGTYLIWLPFLATIEARQLPEKLKKLPNTDWLCANLTVGTVPRNGRGMTGSALFVINPPWTLEAALRTALPILAETLGNDDKAGWSIDKPDAASAKHAPDTA
jgi:23S rRNA (adenine2030-N6)-methyltransferase